MQLTTDWVIKELLQPSFEDKGGWLNICWMGGENWHVIEITIPDSKGQASNSDHSLKFTVQ